MNAYVLCIWLRAFISIDSPQLMTSDLVGVKIPARDDYVALDSMG